MVLSIGMIVRDGEQYLEQCLTALQPILNELDSELIIADTGSTDRTVEIAKKFTDQVYYFEWVNDFSAARNFTLDKARGEWFIYIDQDEVAVDCTGLINFFKSGEYRKYNAGAYVQRNLSSLDDPTHYSDFRQVVAIKKEPFTRFVNEFHEMLSPILPPLKFLDFIVMHYGFAYAGEGGAERERAKSQRNLKGLMDELEHTEGEPRVGIYKQIADCYMNTEPETALKYLDIGMEKMDRNSADACITYYVGYIFCLWNMRRFEELILIADEYFDEEVNPFHTKEYASDAQVLSLRGRVYAQFNRTREAISDLTRFFDMYRRYFSNKLLTDELISVSWQMYDDSLRDCYIMFFASCLKEQEYELAEKYASSMPLKKFLDDRHFIEALINLRIEFMQHAGFNGFGEFYSELDGSGKEYLRRSIFSISRESRDMLLKKMSVLGGTAKELAEIYRTLLFENTVDKSGIYAFIREHGTENHNDMLYILMKAKMSVTPFILAEDFRADKSAPVIFRLFSDCVEVFEDYNINKVMPDALHGMIALYRYFLPHVAVKREPRDTVALFEKFGALGLRWNSMFKNEEAPDEVHAAMFASIAVLAKRNKDRASFVKALDQLKTLVPDLTHAVDTYDRENKCVFPTSEPNDEFEKLAAEVKKNINDLIAAGNLANAQNLLVEFRALCPNDPDIAVMAEAIGEPL